MEARSRMIVCRLKNRVAMTHALQPKTNKNTPAIIQTADRFMAGSLVGMLMRLGVCSISNWNVIWAATVAVGQPQGGAAEALPSLMPRKTPQILQGYQLRVPIQKREIDEPWQPLVAHHLSGNILGRNAVSRNGDASDVRRNRPPRQINGRTRCLVGPNVRPDGIAEKRSLGGILHRVKFLEIPSSPSGKPV